MGGFSIWHWLIVLVIVLAVFGTKKLRNIGQDLGSAVKGFRDGIKEVDNSSAETIPPPQVGQTVDVEVKEKLKS